MSPLPQCPPRLWTLIFGLLLPIGLFAQKAEPLFNGTDLTGWYAFEPETGKHLQATDLFAVDDHMIRLFGPKAGYLMSNRSFHDFDLTLEFRWNTDPSFVRKNDKMNSGLMYLVPESTADTLWPEGIQFQIKDGSTGDFILLNQVTLQGKNEIQGPGKSVTVKRLADAEKPVGEWNALQISVHHGSIRQMLNGVLVNEGSNPSVSEGRILLQYEGFPIDFRNLAIQTPD